MKDQFIYWRCPQCKHVAVTSTWGRDLMHVHRTNGMDLSYSMVAYNTKKEAKEGK